MDEKEKLKFLQKMGFSLSRLNNSDTEKEKKTRRDNYIDKSDLMSLARKFDVTPQQKPAQTLDEFLKEKDGN